MSKDDEFGPRLMRRAAELKESSLDFGHAVNRANLEEMIGSWPKDWGDDLQVIIYGDFRPPDSRIYDNNLGITVHPEKLENTVIRSAL